MQNATAVRRVGAGMLLGMLAAALIWCVLGDLALQLLSAMPSTCCSVAWHRFDEPRYLLATMVPALMISTGILLCYYGTGFRRNRVRMVLCTGLVAVAVTPVCAVLADAQAALRMPGDSSWQLIWPLGFATLVIAAKAAVACLWWRYAAWPLLRAVAGR